MSTAKSETQDGPAKVSYRLSKTRRAAIERAKARGRVDPFAEPIDRTKASRRKRASTS